MAQEVTLPFGALDGITPAIDVDDVTFEIPQDSDIEDAVVDAIFPARAGLQTMDDVIEAIVDEIEANTSIDVPGEGSVIENPLREIYQSVQGGVQLSDDAIGAIVEAIEGATGVDVPGDGSVIDGVEDVILDEETVQSALDEAIRDVFQDTAPENVEVNIEGIFGPLSQDVARALEDIIGFDPDNFADQIVSSIEEQIDVDFPGEGDVENQLPTVDDVQGAVGDEIEGIGPSLGGVNLFDDVIGFLEQLWTELRPLIVSDEAIAELDDALDELDEVDEVSL
jgi:hypothetical protein